MQKKILYTVLNWGLGHAARSIPIIEKLLDENHEVFVASDGDALRLLQVTFPHLTFFTLPAYDIRYPTSNMLWNLMIQSRKFYNAIQNEHVELSKIIKKHQIDEVISDNRFGCFSPLVKKNIFITHQVNLLSPIDFLSPVASYLNQRLLKKFDEIWIPDEENEDISLAGKLSHGNFGHLPPIRYIGIQTRLKKEISYDSQKNYYQSMPLGIINVAVILSGPEPQRTFLSDELLEKANYTNYNFVFVQGLPSQNHDFFTKENIRNIAFLNTENLNNLIIEADFIITRSGYTTLMDLSGLGKKTLLIPTPGQTEQIYLAKKCSQLENFFLQKQGEIDLKKIKNYMQKSIQVQ